MKLFSYIIGICLLLVLAPLPLAAQESGGPGPTPRAVYGFDRDFPPFSFEPAGIPGGFDVDMVAAIFEGGRYVLQMQPLQWDQVLRELAAGGVQLTTGMLKTDQRALIYNFSEQPTSQVRVKFFTKTSNRVGNVRLLKGKNVAVAKDSLYQRVVEDFGDMKIKLYDSELAALKGLINDEVEVFCGREQTAYYYLEKLNVTNILSVGTPLYIADSYMAVSKDRPDLLKLINERMVELANSGRQAEIYRKWFVRELNKQEIDTLKAAASQAATNAYAPYSKKNMGAALLTGSGKIFVGGNVENAVSRVGISAIQTAVGKAVTDGENEFRAIICVGPDGKAVPPTAEDRQLLSEFGRGIITVVESEPGEYITPTIFELLPFAERMRPGQ